MRDYPTAQVAGVKTATTRAEGDPPGVFRGLGGVS